MEFLEFCGRIMKKIKKCNIQHQNYKNQEIHRIPYQNHEKNKNLNIPFQNNQNHENLNIQHHNQEHHEIIRIPCQNHGSQKKTKYFIFRIKNIMKS